MKKRSQEELWDTDLNKEAIQTKKSDIFDGIRKLKYRLGLQSSQDSLLFAALGMVTTV